MLLLGAVGAMLMPDRATAQPPNPLVIALQDLQQEVQALRPRKFYLTTTTHDGLQAPTACTTGYHMASLWEIFDPTDLRYERTLGLNNDDSGSGPPANLSGWIRTGANAQTGAGPGDANCNAYTSNNNADHGTAVQLSEEWDSAANAVAPWDPFVERQCNIPFNVWCVQD
jgi:hypothetical protein